MKAVIYEKYGPPEVLQLREIEKPEPKENELLIRVRATSVTATDSIFRQGKPKFSRLFTGLTKPKHRILGDEFAGEVKATGNKATLFKAGDRVYGSLAGYGAYAEYICVPETDVTIAKMPTNLSYEEVMGCDGYLTALPFLRDTGKLERGQQVLVNGASGSVGSSAVQLAKYLGAEVTGVCSAENVELVKSLGADHVIDYTSEDFTDSDKQYDIIFDTVGKLSFANCKGNLKPQGKFMETSIDLSILPCVLWTAIFGKKKLLIAATGLRPVDERTKDLKLVTELTEAEILKPVLDRTYPLEEMVDAHRYVDQGHKKGNVAVTLTD